MSQSGGFFFIQEDGTCLATGRNTNGQMGTGDTTDRKTPYKINLGNISSVLSYYENITFFITKNNELYFSGNVYLADKGSSGNATNPTKLNDSYIYGQSQNGTTFIIDKNGKLYEKGSNSYGELGNGSTSSLILSFNSNIRRWKCIHVWSKWLLSMWYNIYYK